MELLTYFVTVFPVGLAFLAAMYVRDAKVVPTGENFMPTIEDLKDFI
jgi:hypothetical protein